MHITSDYPASLFAECRSRLPGYRGGNNAPEWVATITPELVAIIIPEWVATIVRNMHNGHIAAILAQFAGLLELHIRKEERSLFPIYEQYITQKVSEQVAWEIEARIGLALQPRHPELLK